MSPSLSPTMTSYMEFQSKRRPFNYVLSRTQYPGILQNENIFKENYINLKYILWKQRNAELLYFILCYCDLTAGKRSGKQNDLSEDDRERKKMYSFVEVKKRGFISRFY